MAVNHNKRLQGVVRAALLVVAAMSSATTAWAVCSRALNVPVAPVGLSVIANTRPVHGDTVGGLYPELLRSLAGKEACPMSFSSVPRARQEVMFETGRADLLVPSTRTPRRDEHGIFIAMVSSRALLVSLQSAPARAPVRSLTELLERRELRVALVRGYDYGEAYQVLLKELAQQGRLVLAADPISVVRTLTGNIADLTIMAPTILIGAVQGVPKLRHLTENLRYEPVDELPWGESGIYVSTHANLPESDRTLLREALEKMARSGAVWKAFQRYYPPNSLPDSIRPR